MTFDQIMLAAECITLARVDFIEKVLLGPLLDVAGGELKAPAESEATRTARLSELRAEHAAGARSRVKAKQESALRMARDLQLPIKEAPPGYK